MRPSFPCFERLRLAQAQSRRTDVPGWLCKVRLADPQEFESLLNAEAYKAHCEGEN